MGDVVRLLRRKQKKRPSAKELLSKSIVEACEKVGSDGKGAGGLVGYLQFMAHNHPKEYARLLERIMPMRMTDG